MSEKHVRPNWWALLLLLALFILGFTLESSARISATGHRILEICLLLGFYGLFDRWNQANPNAFEQAADRKTAQELRKVLADYPWEGHEQDLNPSRDSALFVNNEEKSFSLNWIPAWVLSGLAFWTGIFRGQ